MSCQILNIFLLVSIYIFILNNICVTKWYLFSKYFLKLFPLVSIFKMALSAAGPVFAVERNNFFTTRWNFHFYFQLYFHFHLHLNFHFLFYLYFHFHFHLYFYFHLQLCFHFYFHLHLITFTFLERWCQSKKVSLSLKEGVKWNEGSSMLSSLASSILSAVATFSINILIHFQSHLLQIQNIFKNFFLSKKLSQQSNSFRRAASRAIVVGGRT